MKTVKAEEPSSPTVSGDREKIKDKMMAAEKSSTSASSDSKKDRLKEPSATVVSLSHFVSYLKLNINQNFKYQMTRLYIFAI